MVMVVMASRGSDRGGRGDSLITTGRPTTESPRLPLEEIFVEPLKSDRSLFWKAAGSAEGKRVAWRLTREEGDLG